LPRYGRLGLRRPLTRPERNAQKRFVKHGPHGLSRDELKRAKSAYTKRGRHTQAYQIGQDIYVRDKLGQFAKK
jgi:hypothetical protein